MLITGFANELSWHLGYILLSLLLGSLAYGLGILLYVKAQGHLRAARTSTYYAVAPFIGVGIYFIVLSEPITLSFVIASMIMIAGTYFAVMERHDHEHTNMEHEHRHSHSDGHHDHDHETLIEGEHVHPHIYERLVHAHPHTPDLHHAHKH
ncbi:EamA-like transporter family protein [Geosporobacter subterraneus DSM 17957]|uniref:EamA-like transporter family protein n=1 Tax=Geosporobacter subterraneus DSM 17957 TaxID=1121919 RepID=A0A1M6D0V4_9FIRM|nr:DMT family transporter [Geosporobacter subterraneus]SHI66886.1 EamA-like transporter family protein [Geosporobacter subterraneus DSM 17957]